MEVSEFLHMLDVKLKWHQEEGDLITDCRTQPINLDYKQKSGKNYVRGQTAEFVLYPTYDIGHYELVKRILNSNYRFAAILHDKDLKGDSEPIIKEGQYLLTCDDSSCKVPEDPVLPKYKKEHIHLIIFFENQRTNTAVAKEFNVDSDRVLVFGCLGHRLAYLTHAFNNFKHKYNIDDVCGIPYMLDKMHYSIENYTYSNIELYNTSLDLIDQLYQEGIEITYQNVGKLLKSHRLGEFYFKNNSKFIPVIQQYRRDYKDDLISKLQAGIVEAHQNESAARFELSNLRDNLRNDHHYKMLEDEIKSLQEKNDLLHKQINDLKKG